MYSPLPASFHWLSAHRGSLSSLSACELCTHRLRMSFELGFKMNVIDHFHFFVFYRRDFLAFSYFVVIFDAFFLIATNLSCY